MSSFKNRSDYFKEVATNSKLIAHNEQISDEKKRNSFHRVNQEEELNAACSNWGHFPCVVHIGHDIRFIEHGTGIPHTSIGNHLYFLTRLDKNNYPFDADAIEAAYDMACDAMMEFISYMLEDREKNGVCGQFFVFNLNRAKADQIGPINQTLYGWYLIFEDEKKAFELKFDSSKWKTNP